MSFLLYSMLCSVQSTNVSLVTHFEIRLFNLWLHKNNEHKILLSKFNLQKKYDGDKV